MEFKRLAVVCSRLIFATLASCAGGASTAAALADGIGGQPGSPRKDVPRSKSIFVHTINKGQVITDNVRISNNSDATKVVAVYPIDAITTNSGSFTCKQKVEPVDGAGSWLKFNRTQLTLEKGQNEMVDFTITAPADADAGEHDACVAIEEVGDQGQQTGNLRLRTRSAIRVALTIPGQLTRTPSIAGYQVIQNGESQTYTVQLQNSGNVSADTQVKVRLKTLSGTTVYENGGEYPIMSGGHMELSFKNDKAPLFGGWYIAEASAQYDKRPEVYGTQDQQQLVTLRANSIIIFMMPQPLGLLIMSAGSATVGGWIYMLWRRQRFAARALQTWHTHVVQSGDNLQLLAERHNVHWKRLAKINQLKPPYALLRGSRLRVPAAVSDAPKDSLQNVPN